MNGALLLMIAAARDYTDRGWVVHPLSIPNDSAQSPGKRPLMPGWQKLEHTPCDIEDYIRKGCNIGLVCGRRSGVTVLDIDHECFTHELLDGVEIDTLMSSRTKGRGHMYFQYEPDLLLERHHFIGIEVMSDNETGAGSNIVLPPSIHESGDVYRWNRSDAPIAKMPDALKQNIKSLFEREDKLHDFFKQCRTCFTTGNRNFDAGDPRSKGIWDRPDSIAIHGTDGRRAVLAIISELKASGCPDNLLHMTCKRMFGKEYKFQDTVDELRGVEPIHPKCETLRQFLNIDCTGCTWKPPGAANPKQKDAQRTKKPAEYVMPHEQVDPAPITIDEVLTEFKKAYYIEHGWNVTVPFAYVISNFSDAEPDMFGIIAPSGSNKTETIRALGEIENQFIYPISSLTAHTFVSGLPDNQDLAPILKGRLITIKDFTSILAKKADEVALIFSDFRDITDGYIKKDFGSGVKRQYTGIHSSVLFACTNAIERHYSLYSIMGQRIVFFRPISDPKKARQQAIKNAGKEKEIRPHLHNLVSRLINTILNTQKERLKCLSSGVPEDMQERIGCLCDFLAVVRTHINRDFKGDMAALPEPEFPTRLVKSICKIVDGHALLHARMPTLEDERIAKRLVRDNIPTERLQVLRVMLAAKEDTEITTAEVGVYAKIPTSMTSRVLNDLKALGIVEHQSRELVGGRSDKWVFPKGEFRDTLSIVLEIGEKPKVEVSTESPDSGALRGDNGNSNYDSPFLSSNIILYNNINNNCNNECDRGSGSNLTHCHPSINQEPQPQPSTLKIDLLSFERAGREWEHFKGCTINSSNLIDFCLWYCEQKENDKKPSDIRPIAEHIFKITPPVACITIRALIDVPEFVGFDGKTYQLQKGALMRLPKINADSLIKRGAVEHIKLQTDPELAHAKERVDIGIENFAAELIG